MDQLTSVSDIPLPGEDINNRNEVNHGILQETNISAQHNPEFNKPIENITYAENIPNYSTSNITFDQTNIIINQALEQQEKSISHENTNLMHAIEEIEAVKENIITDPATHIMQETIVEVEPPIESKKSEEQDKNDEHKRQQTLAETVEDLQKFVEQTTQEAVVTVNDNAIESVEITDETTEIISELPEMTTDTAKMVTEPCEITETAEVRTETIESPAEITVNLDEMIDIPVHDNSVEIKDEDISSNNISMNSVELENVSGNGIEPQIKELMDVIEEPEVIQESEVIQEPEVIEEPEIIEATSTPVNKRSIRRNSTIEAIKNEWTETDNLTIEEIKEEGPESTSSPVPVIDEPETDTSQPIEEEVNESEESLTEVIVLQSVNDGLELNLDQNVTIEIIDEIKSKEAESPKINDNQKSNESKNEETVKTNKSTKDVPSDKNSNSDKPDGEEIEKEEPIKKPLKEKGVSIKEERNPPIPCHLLGRNVDNPTEDSISNGRTPPKPRLGVKVPYRFLTSQIVSKQDITNELLEIHAKRNPERDPPAGGDIFFAKKLTQRLANKINQSEKVKKERIEQTNTSISGIPDDALLTPPNSQTSDNSLNTTKTDSQGSSKSLNDNSDLLAILEGDVDVDLTKEIKNTKTKPSDSTDTDNQIEKALENIANTPIVANVKRRKKMDPEMEREIALKQLESLPKEVKRANVRKYGRRGRPFKYYQEPVEMKHEVIETPKKDIKTEEPKAKVIESKSSESKPSKPVEEKVKSPPLKTAVEIAQEKEVSDNVKQAAENIVDKIRKKKLKDISPKPTKKPDKIDDISDDMLDASLTPKKVSKTYSRKDNVVNVNVPADLEQIVNDQSALENEECVEEESPEKPKDEDKKSPNPKSPPPQQQKRSKRSIAEDINTPEVTLVSKRARVIKPKIIWDPAESVPRKIKPQVTAIKPQVASIKPQVTAIKPQVTAVVNQVTAIVSPPKSKRGRPRKSLDIVQKTEESSNKAENDVKKGEKKADSTDEEEDEEEEEEKEEMDIDYKPGKKENKPISRILKKKGKILSRAALNKVQSKKKILIKRQIRSLAGKLIRSTNGDLKSSLALSRKKKQLVQKLANEVKSANKPKKTELDKLLSDEGAVNMLYSVRQDDKVVGKRTSSKLIPSKDLLNRTIALRKVITQSSINEDTPTKALRKKENPPLSPIKITQKERKKSRDSIRSSIQSPPPSPSYASNRAEASRIIRRHSSSFSSDCSSPRRLSIDLQNQENTEKQETKTTEQKEDESKKETTDSPSRSLRRKGVPIYERKTDEKTYKGKKKLLPETETTKESESTKEEKESADRLTPTTDKTDKSEKPDKLSAAEKRKLNSEMSKNFSKSPLPKKRTRNSKTEDDEETAPKEETKAGQSSKSRTTEDVEEKPKRTRHISVTSNYEEISLRKVDNLVQIILTPSNTKLKNSIGVKMFKELNDALTNLAKDDTCRVVLLTSTDSSFCHGVDFSTLVQSNAEKRTAVAQEMAANLRNFLRSLAHFPKPIIAGVQGSAVGLGVTMLPLFDLVFASDKATFSTPYGRLGQVPEGIAFLTLPNLLGNTLTSELMFANRKLTASEAVHHGLVTRTIWPDKFQEDVISSALAISSQSGQSMQATKSLLRQSLLSKLDDALESENKLLISHWTSAECQQNFKKLLQEEEWW